VSRADNHLSAGNHALVLGAGVAGLLAARVLSRYFGTVTVIERDELLAGPAPRPGVPQSRHVHGLLAPGLSILEQLFPDIHSELEAAGAPAVDWVQDIRWFTVGGWKPRFPSGIVSLACSRDLLESIVRRRVATLPNVRFEQRTEAIGLLGSNGAGVSGACIRERASSEEHRTVSVEADLVVDATGRNSRAAEWLVDFGYGPTAATLINSFVGYASRMFEPPSASEYDWKALAMLATPPEGKRGGVIQTIEGNRWMVTLAGAARDYPPTDEDGFTAFARSLPQVDVYQAICRAKPLGPIRGYRRTENQLRHFNRLRRWPSGFIVLGDAVCTLNPIYAQGMTVAAVSAITLDRSLRRWSGELSTTFGYRFQRAVARTVSVPWLLATGEDFRHPTTEGGRPDMLTRFMHRYIDRLQLVATHDPVAHRALIAVLNLLIPPTSLLNPRLIWAALCT